MFSRRDANALRFAQAVAAAKRSGFQVAVRPAGGRAVAYTTEALVVDHVRHEPRAVAGQQARFEHFAALYAGILKGLGIPAAVGAVPDEYCPGAYSVNVRGLGRPFDEGSVGSVGAEMAGLHAADLTDALVHSCTGGRTESFSHETTLNLAHKLLPGHLITP